MAKKTVKKSAESNGYGQLWAVIAGTLVGCTVYAFFIKDALGYPLQGLGSLIWLMAFGGSLVGGLIFFSRFVVPAGWQEGFVLSLIFLGRSLGWALSSPVPAQKRIGGTASVDTIEELPTSFRTVRAGILDSHIALSLLEGNNYSRPAGPGYIRLHLLEMIRQVVDLRPHFYSQEIKARTRDGIPVQTSVNVVYHVSRPLAAQLGSSKHPYPYRHDDQQDAIFRISYAGTVGEAEQLHNWHERIRPEIVATFIAHLSLYTLDRLYADFNHSAYSLEKIKTDIHNELKERFSDYGIELVHVGIGQLVLPEDVMEQRIRDWQVWWKCEIEQIQAQSNAQTLKQQNEVRAKVQFEIIRQIMEGLEKMKSVDTNPTEVFALHVLQTLEKSVAEDVRQARISGDVLETLSRMSHLIGLETQPLAFVTDDTISSTPLE